MSVPKRVLSRPYAFLVCVLSVLIAAGSSADARRHVLRERVSAAPPAAMVVDLYSGHVLYSKNAAMERYPASITKVMTLYLLFDALRDGKLTMRTQLPVSEHAAEQSPTKLGLREGDSIAVADAIGAIVTKSANDMAVTVAEALAGSEENFARLMTQKARTIGMTNTTFKNASGLPNSDQKTTAQDLIVLGKSILADHPERSKVFATRYFQYRGEVMRNHNTMLFSYEGMEGMKTGFTSAAGFNLLASAHRGDKRVLAVVLGGESARSRNAAMRNILDAAWSKAMTKDAARKTGVETASLRQPIERERGFHAESPAPNQGKKVVTPSPRALAMAPAISERVLQLKQKPDKSSSGILIASIEHGLITKPGAGRAAQAELSPDMTTDEPEESAVPETEQTHAYGKPAAQDSGRNEMRVAQAVPGPIQNVSIHYKTARLADVEPLAAVALEAAEPRIVKVRNSGAIKLASAVDQDRPQKLQAASLTASPAAAQAGPYHIQVGSFTDEAQAAARLDVVKQTLGGSLLKAHPEFVVPVALSSGETMYRARLSRFADESQAKSACKKLRSSGIECWDIRAR